MSQNIEIEFKNMITKEEYKNLLLAFKIPKSQIFSQENYYFDTPDFSLKQQESALRIREKHGFYEMTLKQPAAVGLLETNQLLTKEEAVLAIQTGKLPSGIIENLLEKKDISFSTIEYFGSLITKRTEVTYKHGLLVLDFSRYLGIEDYEVEYEVESYQEGQHIFQGLLAQFNIPVRQTENKVRRFYQQKYHQLDL